MHNIIKKINEDNEIIFGHADKIKLALICFFTKGHILIEDVPGVGKTTFAKYIAKILGLNFSRIQFTTDLMPADILGFQVYNQQKNLIDFFPGPIFTDCLLADELNRGSPKTQSALLEAMAESQVTIDKKTHELSNHFFVIATQNPREQIGTNPLPESQLDRFMMKISLGYPDAKIEKKILINTEQETKIKTISPLLKPDELEIIKKEIQKVYVSDPLIEYVTKILQASRSSNDYNGLSPRVGIDLIKAAKAHAYLNSRKEVYPDDIQQIFIPVVSHRLVNHLNLTHEKEIDLSKKLIETIPIL